MELYIKTRAANRVLSMWDSNKRMAMEGDADRLGALPDPVLHYILSLLEMKQVVETSLLSTRWRNLWVSVPALKFDHSPWNKRNRLTKNNRFVKKNFMNFVDRVLSLHDGSTVTNFTISCSSFCDFDRLGGWMAMAARKQIQEFHIEVGKYQAGRLESSELPDDVFCAGVTVFKFYIKPSSSKTCSLIRMPNSISSSPQLKILVLNGVLLPRGDSNGELVLSCPLLETLKLESCVVSHLNVFDISTHQLKNLVINIFDLESCQVKIFTPILESLTIDGRWSNNCSLGSLPSLVYAKIINHHKLSRAPYFIQFLESVSCATTLELCWLLQDSVQESLDGTTISFSNLKCLMIGHIFMSYSNTYLKIFKSSPCLETLVFKVYNLRESQEGLYCLNVDHLKSLEIGWFKCYKYEINLLEYILENAAHLEKITVKMGVYRGKFVDRMDTLVKSFSSRVVLSVT